MSKDIAMYLFYYICYKKDIPSTYCPSLLKMFSLTELILNFLFNEKTFPYLVHINKF